MTQNAETVQLGASNVTAIWRINIHVPTYFLTPWSRVLLYKL